MDATNPSAISTFASRTPLHIGMIGLVARDLDRLANFYRDLLGLRELSRSNETVQLGAGDVPLDRALTGLAEANAAAGLALPPISLEWERAWDPDLAPASLALPRAHAWLVEHLGRLAPALR